MSISGLREGREGVKPDYDSCIDIATKGALRELIPAGLMAIIATLVVGFIGGPKAIGGFLLGNIVSGLLLALFMSNAGGLWDNSKKYIEAGNEGGKGSEAHKAAGSRRYGGRSLQGHRRTVDQHTDNSRLSVSSLMSVILFHSPYSAEKDRIFPSKQRQKGRPTGPAIFQYTEIDASETLKSVLRGLYLARLYKRKLGDGRTYIS